MFQLVLKLIGFLLFVIPRSVTIGIDDKLDFGSSGSHHSSRSQVHGRPHLPISYKTAVTKIGISDHLDGAGVVCGAGGCNNTNSEDTLKTDVVVHIETKVDLNENTSKQVGDTPDVPIVIGYNSEPDRTNDDNRRLDQQSIFIPNSEPIPLEYGSGFAGFNSIPKGYGSGSPGYGLGTSDASSITGMPIYGQVYSSNNQLFYPTRGNYNGNTQNMRTDGYSFSDRSMNEGVNIKILPPVAIGISDNTPNTFVDQKSRGGMELTVPYFEPSLHTHNFGEVPPPQQVWYPKKASSFNPVEFKTMKPAWNPSIWYKTITPHIHTSTPAGQECFCQNGQGQSQPDLRWYPNENRRISDGNTGQFRDKADPGTQINDKLAPLN